MATSISTRKNSFKRCSKIEIKPLKRDFPLTHFENWVSPTRATSELEALESLKLEHEQQTGTTTSRTRNRYVTKRPRLVIDLEDFAVYRSPDSGLQFQRSELVALHLIGVSVSKNVWIDGYIHLNNVKHYIVGASFKEYTVEGYGDGTNGSVAIYLRTEVGNDDASFDIWYCLKNPSQEYGRFYNPFLWVAQLGKYVIDFLEARIDRSISLRHFRKSFFTWLESQFGVDAVFREWHREIHHQIDFRVAVHAHIEYLYQQACKRAQSRQLLGHALWADCMVAGMTSIKKQPAVVKYTVATPFVFENFRHMYFSGPLQSMQPASHVGIQQETRMTQLGFATYQPLTAQTDCASSDLKCDPYDGSPVKVGDVVVFDPDTSDKKEWPNAKGPWLAFVHRIERVQQLQRLFVLYLYRPEDTTIFKAKYMHKTELFFSDHCNCDERKLMSNEIKGKCHIQWSPRTITGSRVFVRQTYLTEDSAFVTFKEEHKKCQCTRAQALPIDGYQRGDTAYLKKTVGGRQVLEPIVISKIDTDSKKVVVRVISQLGRDYGRHARKAGRTHIANNELVLTDEFLEVSAEQIERRCDIRFVPKDDVLKGKIPFPYDRDGAGDFWYISMGIATIDSTTRLLVFLDKLPNEFKEGRLIEDLLRRQKLSGLSIFGGGGNLDRGLEDGGAIEFRTVVDYDEQAIHTQWANARHTFNMHLYCGSVDDYLQQLLSGRWQEGSLIAKIGTVLVIVAGAPCPGFSTLQKNFQSQQSLRNSSHVTSMPSYVDMYRPEYGIFENVPNMASTRTGFEDQNVLSQLIACFVAMGYQVNQFLMDSWSYGSCQQRTRLFLAITAPGLEPILQPPHTHSRPYGEASARSLGQLPNGLRFGERQHYPTPFDYMSAGDATADLPDIGNANVQTCIAFPDHRVTAQPGYMRRKILEYIPRQPPGCGYKEAYKLGLIPPALQKPGKELGKAFRRISKEGLIPTITTRISPQDAHNGAAVHWDQDRSITLQEARRAQGYPDHEVIIGRPADQLRIVGNGVDRKVAFALGLSLRVSVEKNWAVREATAMAQLEKEILVDVEDTFAWLEGEVLVDADDALVGTEGVMGDQGIDDRRHLSFFRHTSNTEALYQQRGESVTLRLKRTRDEVGVFSGDSGQKPAKRRKT